MRRASAAVAVGLLSAGLVGGSLAEPVAAQSPERIVTGPFLDSGEPRFAGDRIAWLSGRSGSFRVFAASTEKAREEVISLPVNELGFEYAVSATRLLVQRSRFFPQTFTTETLPVLTGPLGGPYQQLGEPCRRTPSGREVDLDGEVGLFPECINTSQVQDFSPGAAVPARTVPFIARRLAGRYVVGSGLAGELTVYDWMAGSELYRVLLPTENDFEVRDLAIQADGKMAVIYQKRVAPSSSRFVWGLAWASGAEPRLHVISAVERGLPAISDLRLKDDRIAFLRPSRTSNFRDYELGVSDLTGTTRLVAFPGSGSRQGFDFDGQSVAFVEHRCYDMAIVVQPIDMTSRRFDRSACRLRLRGRPVRTRRGVRVRIDCAGFGSSCGVRRATLRTRDRVTRPRKPRRRVRVGSVRLRKVARRTVTIPLDRSARRLLAAEKPTRLVLSAQIQASADRGPPLWPLERRQRRLGL